MNQKNKTIAEALREGKQRLKAAGKEAYAFEAELLLEKAAGLNRTALFLRGEEELSEEEVSEDDMIVVEGDEEFIEGEELEEEYIEEDPTEDLILQTE